MKKLLMTATVVSALAAAAPTLAAEFTVSSPDIIDGKIAQAQYANTFGCTGGNVSPALEWSGAPAGTKSFVISIYDQDASTGSGFWHWAVINIPADVTSLPSGASSNSSQLPGSAIQTLTDAGITGYAGICPPPGETHQYVITVKAVGVDALPVDPKATGAMVGLMSNINVLGIATLAATN